MRISRRSRYGLRALLFLAQAAPDEPVSLPVIAAHEEVSRAFLERILSDLRHAGLVETRRGLRGGYLLTRRPERITAADVLEVLEGPLVLLDCVDDGDACDRSAECLARPLWDDLSGVMRQALADVSLADLAARHPRG